MPKQCEHCSAPMIARGLCAKHYLRWRRHGDPLIGGGGPRPKGTAEYFITSLAVADTDDCIPWPFLVNPSHGYGQLSFRGRNTQAHRAVAITYHGSQPTPKHEVAHSCGNRLCCNPRHLRWATRHENSADKWTHGTMLAGEGHPRAKLTEAKVRHARQMAGVVTHDEIAAMFGVSRATVSLAIERKTWAHVSEKAS